MILNTSWWLIRKPPQSEAIYPYLTSLWEFWYGWPKVSLATHQFQQFLNFKVAMADIFLIFHAKNGSSSRVSMLVLTWAMTYKGPQNINWTSFSTARLQAPMYRKVQVQWFQVPSFNLNTEHHGSQIQSNTYLQPWNVHVYIIHSMNGNVVRFGATNTWMVLSCYPHLTGAIP